MASLWRASRAHAPKAAAETFGGEEEITEVAGGRRFVTCVPCRGAGRIEVDDARGDASLCPICRGARQRLVQR